jgi:hypothetical protein
MSCPLRSKMLMVNWPKMTRFVSNRTRPSRVSPSPEMHNRKNVQMFTFNIPVPKVIHLMLARNIDIQQHCSKKINLASIKDKVI